MEWNNGTIFRAFINSGPQREITCKLDIAQEELTNKVFIGVENFALRPDVSTGELQDYWARTKYIQLESFQLTPYIDFTSQNNGQPLENANNSRNTNVFARLPLIASPTLGSQLLTTAATFAGDRVLNKDSILYEMRNNPNALSNGQLRFRIVDENGNLVEDITSFAFTLVIYKPDNEYN